MVVHIKETKTIFEKSIGLIGKKKPQNILIKTRFGIHTFGLQFPIDVVILNKNSEIVTWKERLMPNRVYFWHPMYNTVLELVPGTIPLKILQEKKKLTLVLN